MATFKGSTREGQEMMKAQDAANAPFISAAYWKEGMRVSFVVLSVHKSANGPYVGAQLVSPMAIAIEGKRHTLVRIGNLAGIGCALRKVFAEVKSKYFQVGDGVVLTCTGITPPEQEGYSPMPNFDVDVERPDAKESEEAPAAPGKEVAA